MKYQLFEDAKAAIKLNPKKPAVFKTKINNKPLDVAIFYDGNGLVQLNVLKSSTQKIIYGSPWTDSYKILENYVKANNLGLAEYKN